MKTSTSTVHRLLLVLGTLLLTASALVAGGRVASADPATVVHDADGLTVTSATADGPRLWRFTVATAELSRPVRVNVLLPAGYSASTSQRYPTLYLFHGTSGGADDWLQAGNVTAATAGYPMIVVMPDAGYAGNGGGWFTDWVDQHTSLGTADWESFHIDQLVPWVDANFRTIADRSGRAVAGLSQGGFGSFSYAARHPDLFVSAASFSGAPDIAQNVVTAVGGAFVVGAIATGLEQVQPFAMFGDPILDRINWQGHNPADLVTNMASTDLELWTGLGVPGPLDTDLATAIGGMPVETITHLSTLSFASAATQAHVSYSLDDYGPGTHNWPYWARDLTQYLPSLATVFAAHRAAPAVIGYRSIDATWSQWGWTVRNSRPLAQDWSSLSAASRTGFRFDGVAATVTTPAFYAPGSVVTLTVGGTPRSAVADTAGRVTVSVTGGQTVTLAGGV